MKPFHDPSLPHFSSLSQEKKQSALHYVRRIWGITQHHVQNHVDAENNAMALWSALKSCGLTPGSDLFGHLEGDDKIEIYTLNGIQIWRNCNVMEICSYTLEEIYSFDWQERYERSPRDNQAIMAAIDQAIKPGGNFRAMIPRHQVVEKFSENRLCLNVRHDYFFPLMGPEREVSAFLVTSKVEIASKEDGLPSQRREPNPLSLVEGPHF